MSIQKLGEGKKVDFYAVFAGGKCEFREYVESGLEEIDRKKVFALLKNTLDNGIPKNIDKFKHLEDQIYEFKADKIRLLGFFKEVPGKPSFVFVEGYRKQQQRADKEVLKRVKRIRDRELGVKHES